MTTRVLSQYDAETKVGKWFSPSDGRLLLELDGLSIEQSHLVSAAIRGADSVARQIARRDFRNHLDRTMEAHCDGEW